MEKPLCIHRQQSTKLRQQPGERRNHIVLPARELGGFGLTVRLAKNAVPQQADGFDAHLPATSATQEQLISAQVH